MNESKYFVWGVGKELPEKCTDSAEEAITEAKRLCMLPDNIGREFLILRTIQSIQYRTDPFVIKTYCKK